MQLTLTPETPEEALTVRALEARAMERGETLVELFHPWTIDQAFAAVDRAALTEESVQAAEARGRAARQLRDAQTVLANPEA